jgi:hypothetical protein
VQPEIVVPQLHADEPLTAALARGRPQSSMRPRTCSANRLNQEPPGHEAIQPAALGDFIEEASRA